MLLNVLYEQNLGPYAGFSDMKVAEHADDTNKLVAYRVIRFNRRGHTWIVNLNGQAVCTIGKDDSQWVHDNWQWSFFWKGDLEGEPAMNRENRAYLESMLRELSHKIKEAISKRQADVVVLEVDPNML